MCVDQNSMETETLFHKHRKSSGSGSRKAVTKMVRDYIPVEKFKILLSLTFTLILVNSWLLISKKVQHIQVQVTTTTLWSTQPCARQTPTSGIIFKYPWPQIHISKNPHNPRIHKSTYPQVAPSHQANHSALHALRLKFWSWSKISLKQRPHSKLGVKYLHRWVHR